MTDKQQLLYYHLIGESEKVAIVGTLAKGALGAAKIIGKGAIGAAKRPLSSLGTAAGGYFLASDMAQASKVSLTARKKPFRDLLENRNQLFRPAIAGG